MIIKIIKIYILLKSCIKDLKKKEMTNYQNNRGKDRHSPRGNVHFQYQNINSPNYNYPHYQAAQNQLNQRQYQGTVQTRSKPQQLNETTHKYKDYEFNSNQNGLQKAVEINLKGNKSQLKQQNKQRQQSVDDSENFKLTLVNVLAGFVILVIIVTVFYIIIQFNKAKNDQNAQVININNPSSNQGNSDFINPAPVVNHKSRNVNHLAKQQKSHQNQFQHKNQLENKWNLVHLRAGPPFKH